jgi:hypothetical protein
MSVACQLSPQQRKSLCQSATSEARTTRIARQGGRHANTVVGPRPADASWTYNAQTLGQLRNVVRIASSLIGFPRMSVKATLSDIMVRRGN